MLKIFYNLFIILILFSCFVSADRLPSQVPENQIFTIDTLVDVTGIVSEESELDWTIESISDIIETAWYSGETFDYSGEEYAIYPYEIDHSSYHQLLNYAEKYGSDMLFSAYSLTGPYNLTFLRIAEYLADEPIEIKGKITTLGDLMAALRSYPNYSWDTYKNEGIIHDGKLNRNEEITLFNWEDSIKSNGGKLLINMNVDFDSQNKRKGLNNLQTEKVLTYASTEGAHLVGSEEWTLDVAGNWEVTESHIRCVFATASSEDFPAFCNVVKAKSELVNINSAQISTKGSARGVAASVDIPAMLNYQIAVTPDSNSGSGFADGTVKTLFGGSIMEARGKNQEQSVTNNWKDTASVTGGIKNFQKTFSYESGFMF